MCLFTIIIHGSAFKSIQTCKHNYIIYTVGLQCKYIIIINYNKDNTIHYNS